mgnify:CR=1 FL=1
MKKEVINRDKIVVISYGDEFAILAKKPVKLDLQTIILSIPVTAAMADHLDSSKIIQVQRYTVDGTIFFTRKFGFESNVSIADQANSNI